MTNDEMDTPPEENVSDEDALIEDDTSHNESEAAAPPDVVTDIVELDATNTDKDADESVHVQLDDAGMATGMDVEAALAAVASLSTLTARETTADIVEHDTDDYDEMDVNSDDVDESQPLYESVEPFERPPLLSLNRGQIASVVPALLLMGIGAWLTFALTTSSAPDTGLLMVIALAAVGVVLLAHWLASGRWARGSFLGGLFILLLGATTFILLRPDEPGLVNGWPLLFVTAGAAFILTALLTQPREGRLALFGVMLAVAGLIAYSITSGILGTSVVTTVGSLWPVVLVIVLAVLLLPLVFKRRN